MAGGWEVGAFGTVLVLLCAANDSDGLAVAFVIGASDPPILYNVNRWMVSMKDYHILPKTLKVSNT